jgi:hypothetical protein
MPYESEHLSVWTGIGVIALIIRKISLGEFILYPAFPAALIKPRITLAKMIVRDNRLYFFLYRIFQIILTKKPGIRQNRFLP